LFLFAEDFVKADYLQETQEKAWTPWISEVGQLQSSVENNVWNAKPNFTCRGWCPVTSCVHNQGSKNG